jgi:hypothetical protein
MGLFDVLSKPLSPHVDDKIVDFKGATIDDIYEAFAYAETGGETDPWIRTKGTKGQRKGTQAGSNAYGPVQMLSSYVHNATKQVYRHNNKMIIPFTSDELSFIDRFKKQGAEFYKHGNKKGTEGYNPIYEYGASGDMSVSDRPLYESVAKKIMAYELNRGGGIYNLKRIWRHGDTSGIREDKDYFEKFDYKLNQILKKRKKKEDKAFFMGDEEVMNDVLK